MKKILTITIIMLGLTMSLFAKGGADANAYSKDPEGFLYNKFSNTLKGYEDLKKSGRSFAYLNEINAKYNALGMWAKNCGASTNISLKQKNGITTSLGAESVARSIDKYIIYLVDKGIDRVNNPLTKFILITQKPKSEELRLLDRINKNKIVLTNLEFNAYYFPTDLIYNNPVEMLYGSMKMVSQLCHNNYRDTKFIGHLSDEYQELLLLIVEGDFVAVDKLVKEEFGDKDAKREAQIGAIRAAKMQN